MINLYECATCAKKFEIESEARNCCNQTIYFEDGDFKTPTKRFLKPLFKSHICKNVTHGGKSWSINLFVEEKCPMCDYAYRPR